MKKLDDLKFRNLVWTDNTNSHIVLSECKVTLPSNQFLSRFKIIHGYDTNMYLVDLVDDEPAKSAMRIKDIATGKQLAQEIHEVRCKKVLEMILDVYL